MFHFGPFALENAEVDGVAYAAGGRDQVLTQGAFFFCADAKNSVARLLIEGVGLQFDADAVADFEGVLKHQEFRSVLQAVRCQAGAIQVDPISALRLGTSMFMKRVLPMTVPEARSTVAKTMDSPELLFGEGAVHVAVEVVWRLHRVGNPAKDVGKVVFRGFPEKGFVLGTERFETDDVAFESDGCEGGGGWLSGRHEQVSSTMTGRIVREHGEPGRTRTFDPRLKRALLYHLSYWPMPLLI